MPVRGTPPNSAYYHTVCPSITALAEVGLTHHRGGTAVAAGAPLGARGRLPQRREGPLPHVSLAVRRFQKVKSLNVTTK